VSNQVGIAQEVLERLLVAKGLLSQIRDLPTTRPDRITLARQILTAHDAAELALAAIACHLGLLPTSRQTYLMEYFPAIQKHHPGREVAGRDYFGQLNQVRIDIKHLGIFPDPDQWKRVGERTWAYVSGWCQDYLSLPLDDVDESALIRDTGVKQSYDSAVEAFHRDDYKAVFELLAFATGKLFDSNKALRNLVVGLPKAEDAIKLAAFGVHANDFLALQEFLPRLVYSREHNPLVKWEQEKHGHPANWNRDAAEFCLRTFVDVALRIQDAAWIPGAIDFEAVYEHKVTAVVDNVEILGLPPYNAIKPPYQIVVRRLRKGDSLRGIVSRKEPLLSGLMGPESKQTVILTITSWEEKFWGEVEADKVKVTCVPRNNSVVRDYFPDLPEIDYIP